MYPASVSKRGRIQAGSGKDFLCTINATFVKLLTVIGTTCELTVITPHLAGSVLRAYRMDGTNKAEQNTMISRYCRNIEKYK